MRPSRKAEFFQQITWSLVLMVLGLFLMVGKVRNSRLAELISALTGRKKPNP